jgi:hypothetical protein
MTVSLALLVALILTATTICMAVCKVGAIASRLDLSTPRYTIYVALHAALSAGAWLLWFLG